MSNSLPLLRDEVYRDLKQDILTGCLSAGERLQEAPLAERFETSKTPVREALLRLVQENLLVVFPRVGYIVTDVTVEDAQAVLDFRALLESSATELAARYITERELEHLEALATLEFRAHEPLTYREFLQQNRRFHLLIAQASRNRYLVEALDSVFDKVDRLLHYRLDLDESDVERIEAEHRAVVDALRAHDTQAAREAALAGLDRTRDEALRSLMSGTRQAVPVEVPRVAGGR